MRSMKVSLVILKEDGEIKDFPLTTGTTVVGRLDECDLRILRKEISRKHATIVVSQDSVTICDLGSSNGTYINNKRIASKKEEPLSAGDHLILGPVVFTVRIDGKPEQLRPFKINPELRSTETEEEKAPVNAAPPVIAESSAIDFDDEQDPISILEAMASSDETAQIDLEGSSFDLNDSKT